MALTAPLALMDFAAAWHENIRHQWANRWSGCRTFLARHAALDAAA